MNPRADRVELLLAEDDPEDQLLFRKAFEIARLNPRLRIVNDGVELMDYLRRRASYAAVQRPDLLLLDLNMPRKDGREALAEIKNDPDLRRIPVVVMTTSAAEQDIRRAYELGANSYIEKPATFSGLVEILQTLGRYWFDVVRTQPRE